MKICFSVKVTKSFQRQSDLVFAAFTSELFCTNWVIPVFSAPTALVFPPGLRQNLFKSFCSVQSTQTCLCFRRPGFFSQMYWFSLNFFLSADRRDFCFCATRLDTQTQCVHPWQKFRNRNTRKKTPRLTDVGKTRERERQYVRAVLDFQSITYSTSSAYVARQFHGRACVLQMSPGGLMHLLQKGFGLDCDESVFLSRSSER